MVVHPARPYVGHVVGLDLEGDCSVCALMMAKSDELLRVTPQVPEQEPRCAQLVPLAYMNELVREQLARTVAIGVVGQQHEPAEGHARSTGCEHRHLDDADAPGKRTRQHVVRVQLAIGERAHRLPAREHVGEFRQIGDRDEVVMRFRDGVLHRPRNLVGHVHAAATEVEHRQDVAAQ